MDFRGGDALRLFGVGGAVRELVGAADRDDGGSARRFGRARGGRAGGARRQPLYADRVDADGRAFREKRDFDRRVRSGVALEGG